MNLPRVSYISPGPSAPERSIDSATAPARALAEVGREIFGAGQQGFAIAEKVRKVRESDIRSKFMAEQQQLDADFFAGLLRRSDYENFAKEYQDQAAKRRGAIDSLGLSPEGKAILNEQFLDYTTQQGIRIETQASLSTVREGRAMAGVNIREAAKMRDHDGVERAIFELEAQGASPSEVASARLDAEETMREADWVDDINTNPKAAGERLKDPAVRKSLPPADVARYEGMIRSQDRVVAYQIVEDFNNGLLDGSISKPEQIEKRFPTASATLKRRMIDDLQRELTDRERAYRQTPEYQNEVAGRVAEILDNYNIQMDGFDEQFYEMDKLTRTLPEGEMKARLNYRIDNVRKGQVDEWRTAGDEYRERLKDAYAGGSFGDTLSRTTVQDFLNAGLLKDREKLVKEGFTPEESEKIATTEDPWKQLEQYRELHKKKSGYSYSEPYDLAAFELLAKPSQEGWIEYPDQAKQVQAKRNYGEALSKWEKWDKAHPQASAQEREKTYYSLVKPAGAQQVRAAIIPPPPRLAPPQDPKKLPETPSDATGTLLPPRDAQ